MAITTILVEVVVAEGAKKVKIVAVVEDAAATVGPPTVRFKAAQMDKKKKSSECRYGMVLIGEDFGEISGGNDLMITHILNRKHTPISKELEKSSVTQPDHE
ncbi:hypothetical protein PR202_ga23453 [Eleusine coracana subsp. coracana]|uniref:Uncharacterized protein n=1 Tax=Eleusine coracana subsp. coracana TaxID=191504 RepID=A0AAV5D487_ELECO|nr:hypothetical protein PR202_ga23453 [Eleusine coracana subsp. coracana]